MKFGLKYLVLYTSIIILNCSIDDKNIKKKYGVILLRHEYLELYICYERINVTDDDDDTNWLSKSNLNSGYCFDSNWSSGYCMNEAIAQCKWEHTEPHEIVVMVVYPLTYSYTHSEDRLKTLIQNDKESFNLDKSYNIDHYELIILNEKTSALLDLLKFNYDTESLYLDQTSSFIHLSKGGLVVGLFRENSADSDDYGWMKKKFYIRNKHYNALLNNFYCLTSHHIRQAALVKLYMDKIKEIKRPNEQIVHPCLSTGYKTTMTSIDDEDMVCVPSSFENYNQAFEGKYNFDECQKLINFVINDAEFCVGNKHCNLATIRQLVLGDQFNKIVIYNDRVSFDDQEKIDMIKTLYQSRKVYCSDGTLMDYGCIKFHILYALLRHQYFIGDRTIISLKIINPFETNDTTWPYLLMDWYYGNILSEDEIVNINKFSYKKTTQMFSSIGESYQVSTSIGDTSQVYTSIEDTSQSFISTVERYEISSSSDETSLIFISHETTLATPASSHSSVSDVALPTVIIAGTSVVSTPSIMTYSTEITKFTILSRKFTSLKITIGILASVTGISLTLLSTIILYRCLILGRRDFVDQL